MMRMHDDDVLTYQVRHTGADLHCLRLRTAYEYSTASAVLY